MRRGQKTSAEQVVLKLRRIEVQTAQSKSLALACKEAEISEQLRDECLRQEIFYSLDPTRKPHRRAVAGFQIKSWLLQFLIHRDATSGDRSRLTHT